MKWLVRAEAAAQAAGEGRAPAAHAGGAPGGGTPPAWPAQMFYDRHVLKLEYKTVPSGACVWGIQTEHGLRGALRSLHIHRVGCRRPQILHLLTGANRCQGG